MDTLVVWNLDARHRPELEVEIDIVVMPDEIPGCHHATLRPELEVEMMMVEIVEDRFDEEAWFLDDDAVVSTDHYAA